METELVTHVVLVGILRLCMIPRGYVVYPHGGTRAFERRYQIGLESLLKTAFNVRRVPFRISNRELAFITLKSAHDTSAADRHHLANLVS